MGGKPGAVGREEVGKEERGEGRRREWRLQRSGGTRTQANKQARLLDTARAGVGARPRDTFAQMGTTRPQRQRIDSRRREPRAWQFCKSTTTTTRREGGPSEEQLAPCGSIFRRTEPEDEWGPVAPSPLLPQFARAPARAPFLLYRPSSLLQPPGHQE